MTSINSSSAHRNLRTVCGWSGCPWKHCAVLGSRCAGFPWQYNIKMLGATHRYRVSVQVLAEEACLANGLEEVKRVPAYDTEGCSVLQTDHRHSLVSAGSGRVRTAGSGT